ncbi:response regulator transcription factor [Salinibacterium soli]|uniref:Response regulator transcription factor n=1 Tax=Antiquaquibacter soli TaxID=3064523 RepID=A0ABT9BK79_9MICO|nr:response regulator transcription factor [Protaetiibacter sp. WY-16]MDO7881430.1 response regulator transcription factor [Protaetiibacter sp. WY-16]
MTELRPPRILIVDEEEPITHLLSVAVELEGWHARSAADGASAIREVARFEPDIILIDVGLPDVPGTEVVAFLRERGMTTPVVFLTGRSSHEDRLAAFASGGDDFVTKPFGLEEVIDRLHPIIRRLGLAPTSRTVADLVLDDEAGVAWRGDQFLPLTPLEYEMLHALAERPGARMSVGELIRATAVRGIRVPRDFADRILGRVKDLVNGAGRALVHGDDGGWMLAAG